MGPACRWFHCVWLAVSVSLCLFLCVVSRLTHRLLKSRLFYCFSNPAEESAWLLTKLSTVSVSSFFLIVNHLTYLLKEQNPAVQLLSLSSLQISSLSVSDRSVGRACIRWEGYPSWALWGVSVRTSRSISRARISPVCILWRPQKPVVWVCVLEWMCVSEWGLPHSALCL